MKTESPPHLRLAPAPAPSAALVAARRYTRRGWRVIPIPFKSKAPRLKGWQKLRLTEKELPKWFNCAAQNLGVLLGEPSSWVVDIDLDDARCVERAAEFLPPTPAVFGRAGKPRSHWIYRVTAPVEPEKHNGEAGMLAELRATGCQTVFPPSVHPTGERIEWEQPDAEPAVVNPETLRAAVRALADAVKGERGAAKRPADATPTTPTPGANGEAAACLRALLRMKMKKADGPDGSRRLFAAACQCVRFNLSDADAIGAVRAYAQVQPFPREWSDADILDRVRDAERKAERGEALRRRDADGDEEEDGGGRKPSAATAIVAIAEELFRFGQTPDGEPFAVRIGGPNIALMFRGSRDALRATLAGEYRRQSGKVPSASALADALNVLAGAALGSPPEPVALRLAAHDGSVVLDLGGADGRAVVVRPDGWEVVQTSPVLFRRTALTAALPEPTRGGDIEELRAFLNADDESWLLLVAWLVAALIPDIPHPILLLSGQQGTGKTTAARLLLRLIDAATAETRSAPRDPEQWAVAAAGSWCVIIDNISHIGEWFSDSLCKAVTGDGWVRRKLYTDGELAVLNFRRVVVLTSIDAGALRGDLGRRLVRVELEPIDLGRRRDETGLHADFAARRPAILGALFDLLARVLAELPKVRLPPIDATMIDAARVFAAIDVVRGTAALDTYVAQAGTISKEVVEADALGEAIIKLMETINEWTGTAGELRERLTPEHPPRGWPANPRAMAGRLKRLIPALTACGLVVEYERAGRTRTRTYVIRRSGADGTPANADGTRAPDRPHENRVFEPETGVADGADGADGTNPPPSSADGAPVPEPDGEPDGVDAWTF